MNLKILLSSSWPLNFKDKLDGYSAHGTRVTKGVTEVQQLEPSQKKLSANNP